MIRNWTPMYSAWIFNGTIKQLKWVTDDLGKPSDKIAGLIIYITLLINNRIGEEKITISYSRLSELNGLSRELIKRGNDVLIALGIIKIEKKGRSNVYEIIKPNSTNSGGWCKLPVKLVINKNGKTIDPLRELKLRKKVELHALKIFLYLAAIRDNYKEYSTAKYTKISDALSICPTDISKALALLIVNGLLVKVITDKIENSKFNEANKYYLVGYKSFIN